MGVFTGEAENPKYYYNRIFDNGIVIMIGDQNFTSLDQEGILVSPGRWANIALTKSTSRNLHNLTMIARTRCHLILNYQMR